jgi:hypothetical protein
VWNDSVDCSDLDASRDRDASRGFVTEKRTNHKNEFSTAGIPSAQNLAFRAHSSELHEEESLFKDFDQKHI